MSKTMNYTVEEINLMCIYHTSDRYILIKEMETAPLCQRRGDAYPDDKYTKQTVCHQ